jgi:hypothetical protein
MGCGSPEANTIGPRAGHYPEWVEKFPNSETSGLSYAVRPGGMREAELNEASCGGRSRG